MKITNKMIKRTIRRNMPETNSSSCHVLAIFPGDVVDLSEIKQCISDDGKTLTIPGGGMFDRGQEDFNDTISKMQYACYEFESYYSHHKPIFEEVVKDFLGVENIIYDWVDNNKVEEWCENNPDEDIEDCPHIYSPIDGHKLGDSPYVDHESVSTIDHIIYESKETLRDFLFSKDSWIFSGEETTDPAEKFPALNTHSGYLTLRLAPDNINLYGDEAIDFEIYSDFPESGDQFEYGIRRTYWGDGVNSQDWVSVEYRYTTNTEDKGDETILRLNKVWAKKDNGRFYLMFGDIPSTKDTSVYVPWFLPDSFKYPFTVNFYPVTMFTSNNMGEKLHCSIQKEYSNDDPKVNKVMEMVHTYDSNIAFSINMIPSFSNIKINEYI